MGRAECARVALHISGVPFEDARMDYDGMYSSGALTFGTFPALVVGGKGVLNQTQAIARYVGSITGMYPTDPFLAAKCDEAIDGLTDISVSSQRRCRSVILSARFSGGNRSSLQMGV